MHPVPGLPARCWGHPATSPHATPAVHPGLARHALARPSAHAGRAVRRVDRVSCSEPIQSASPGSGGISRRNHRRRRWRSTRGFSRIALPEEPSFFHGSSVSYFSCSLHLYCLLFIVQPLHDSLILHAFLVTMIHSRADHCITNDHGQSRSAREAPMAVVVTAASGYDLGYVWRGQGRLSRSRRRAATT